MTLEERIKEIEEISNANVTGLKIDDDFPREFKDMLAFAEGSGQWRGKIILAEKALSIIQELQTKNKELEAKLNEERKYNRKLVNIIESYQEDLNLTEMQTKLKELNNGK